MQRYSTLGFASVLTVLAATAANAQTSVDRSFDPSPKDCSDVKWSQAAVNAFPSIADACQAVEQRNGKSYVKFEGTVESVGNQGKRLRVDFKDGETLTFRPTPHTSLYINGDRTDFANVSDGTKLNFYVPEDRLQAELQPNPQRLAFMVFPLDMPEQTANNGADFGSKEQSTGSAQRSSDMRASNDASSGELPSTAGPIPLLGLSGLIVTFMGAGATALRRWKKPQ